MFFFPPLTPVECRKRAEWPLVAIERCPLGRRYFEIRRIRFGSFPSRIEINIQRENLLETGKETCLLHAPLAFWTAANVVVRGDIAHSKRPHSPIVTLCTLVNSGACERAQEVDQNEFEKVEVRWKGEGPFHTHTVPLS
mmetsp:Transcript_44956/g.116425  ORF Transcript_44956/g.116425 Transcript_44956/m.116425 type:complete len:139 (-) Transcript_44956:412-828(-)